jgi:hypothetical protein
MSGNVACSRHRAVVPVVSMQERRGPVDRVVRTLFDEDLLVVLACTLSSCDPFFEWVGGVCRL